MRVFTIFAIAALWTGLAAEARAQEKPPARPDPRAEAFRTEITYASKFIEVNGVSMHYVEAGEGTPYLFLHGNPTSSYLWRNVMPHVEPVGRVIAVDLVGFGRSGKPDIGYTLQEHQVYVDGFIEALKLKDLVLVIHDWGSVLGLNYARNHEDNVRGVAMMEAIIPPGYPKDDYESMGPAAAVFRQFRDPEKGKQLIIEQNAFTERMINGALTRKLSEAEADVYRAPFTDPKSRFPVYVWPNELPIGGVPERNVKEVEAVGAWLRVSPLPKLLLYARPGGIVSPESAQWMAKHYKNLETVFVGYGFHFIQEDNPEAIGRGIADWSRRALN